jgi:N,N'-diacetyllegionaminate synthase
MPPHPAPAPITVGGTLVGEGCPCLLIAEAGVNHDGDPERAHALVAAAADAGADAVKFQAFVADDLAAEGAAAAPYQRESGAETQRDLLRGLELEPETFASLARDAEARGLIFLASAFDEASLDMLDRVGVVAYKIASPDVANPLLLAAVGARGRPVLLSTGTADLAEVESAVSALRAAGADDLIVLHCTSAYPAPADESNLRAMTTMRDALRVPVGFSDHTQGDEIALAAVALGACVLEKHFTLDRSLPGPDHRASLEPDELALLVERVRRVESALGDGVKAPTAAERANAVLVRRSIAAAEALSAGTIIELEMLTALRPGTGIPAARVQELVGRRLRRSVSRHELLDAADLE